MCSKILSMKLPVIRHIAEFIEQNDVDFVHETIETLEHITELSSLKDDEIDVLGELLSNLYGAVEVHNMMEEEGLSRKDAANSFMKRVMGSIDT